jgi:hypothetical protein
MDLSAKRRKVAKGKGLGEEVVKAGKGSADV